MTVQSSWQYRCSSSAPSCTFAKPLSTVQQFSSQGLSAGSLRYSNQKGFYRYDTKLYQKSTSNKDDDEETTEPGFQYIESPKVPSKQDLFALPYIKTVEENNKKDASLPNGIVRLNPSETRVTEDRVVEVVDRFKFQINQDQLEKLKNREKNSITANQITGNKEVLTHGNVELDESFLKALEDAEVVESEDTITYRLEVDMEDFNDMVKVGDDEGKSDPSKILINEETALIELEKVRKIRANNNGYETAKGIIQRNYGEFSRLLKEKKKKKSSKSSKFTIWDFIKMIEFDSLKEILNECMLAHAVIVAFAAYYYLEEFVCDFIVKCATFFAKFVDKMAGKKLPWINMLNGALVLSVSIIYPIYKYLRSRNPDYSFAGYSLKSKQ